MSLRKLNPRSLILVASALLILMASANPADAQFWKRGKAKKADKEGKAGKNKKDKDHRCEDITLEWMPDEDYSDLDAVNLTGIASVPIEVGMFSDKRRQDDLREVGRNIEDADEDDEEDRKILYVTTDDDIAEFVRSHTEEVLSELGFNVVGPGEGRAIVTGNVRKFYVTEDSLYKAETRLLLKLATRSGKSLYEGMHGESENTFGKSYKCSNYFEVLSESLVETVHDMTVQDEFYDAMKKLAR